MCCVVSFLLFFNLLGILIVYIMCERFVCAWSLSRQHRFWINYLTALMAELLELLWVVYVTLSIWVCACMWETERDSYTNDSTVVIETMNESVDQLCGVAMHICMCAHVSCNVETLISCHFAVHHEVVPPINEHTFKLLLLYIFLK